MDRIPYFLVAGIDFGTSFSKMVIQSHGRDKGRAYVVNVDGHWLIPSIVGLEKNGKLKGPLMNPLSNAIPYLKILASEYLNEDEFRDMPIDCPEQLKQYFDKYSSETVIEALLVWYFSNLISAVRFFIKTNTDWRDFDFSRGHDDYCCFQLCVPTVYESDEKLRKLFLESLKIGYLLSEQLDGHMDKQVLIEDVINFCKNKEGFINDDYMESICFEYPEVASAVQTVLRAPTAEDGIYITFDVGAGTVDMNIFRRNTLVPNDPDPEEEDNNQLNYYAANMSYLGAARLKSRINLNPYTDFNIKLSSSQKTWGLNPISESQLEAMISEKINDLLSKSLSIQPNLGEHPGQRTYDSAKVYAWGGGYRHPTYRKYILNVLNGFMEPEREVFRLPVPSNLHLEESEDFDRLAIAYGLSFPPIDLQQITLPKDMQIWEERTDINKNKYRTFSPEDWRDDNKRPSDYWTNPKYNDLF